MSLSEEIAAWVGFCSNCEESVLVFQLLCTGEEDAKGYCCSKPHQTLIPSHQLPRVCHWYRENPENVEGESSNAQNMKPNGGNFTFGSSVDLNGFGGFMDCI